MENHFWIVFLNLNKTQNMVSVQDAFSILKNSLPEFKEVEYTLLQARNHVLSQALQSPINMPPFKQSTLIFILILNVTIQIWLLYASLNNALDNNREILIPAFIASLILFLIGFSWLYYLPKGNYRK